MATWMIRLPRRSMIPGSQMIDCFWGVKGTISEMDVATFRERTQTALTPMAQRGTWFDEWPLEWPLDTQRIR